MTFILTPKQEEAQAMMAGSATHCMLFGGSRSGKTALHIRNVVFRSLKAPGSRHGVFRFRYNHLRSSIILDTFPKIMKLAYTGVNYQMHAQDGYADIDTGKEKSQIWFAGLDDKDRTEKILGMEFATMLFNECSQIPHSSVATALTRLAQRVDQCIDGRGTKLLRLRAFYDCNPPPKTHWTYRKFIEHRDPDTRQPLRNSDDYVAMQINPTDNLANLSPEYIEQLENLPARMRSRFLLGQFADANPNALFPGEVIDTWRVIDGNVPDFVRVVVAVDPSGAGDSDNADNDAIGIVVAALGTDGNAYVLEDCTVKAGPGTWGRIATSAFDRHAADCVVGEVNFGGAMVQQTIQIARPRTPFKRVTASRGKVARAEPYSALYESGKVRHVGFFPELEDELTGFSTAGFTGNGSPNRADALIWALTELFPAIVASTTKPVVITPIPVASHWNALRKRA